MKTKTRSSTVLETARSAITKAHSFLIQQIGELRPGWGNAPGDDIDPWPTSQICYYLPKTYHPDVLRALAWLQDAQRPSGAWATATYGLDEDCGATSCVLIALIHYLGSGDLAVQRGLRWLCDSFKNGWTMSPRVLNPFARTKTYYTAYALRALSRGPKSYISSIIIPEAVAVLLEQQNADGGWSQNTLLNSDVSFTCFALHALIDVSKFWNIGVPEDPVKRGVRYILKSHSPSKAWSDWHGLENSPDASGSALYTVLSSGLVSCEHRRVLQAVNAICQLQDDSGGWGLPGTACKPLNWVTNLTLSGLRAFVNAATTSPKIAPARRPKMRPLHTYRQLDHFANDVYEIDPLLHVLVKRERISEFEADYQVQVREELIHFPVNQLLQHTMADGLPNYVAQKIPADAIREAIAFERRILVVGMYHEHFEKHFSVLKFNKVKHVPFVPRHKKVSAGRERRFNSIRPQYYWCDRDGESPTLVCAVFPGRDYVLHYATLIRHYAYTCSTRSADLLSVIRFPLVENSLAVWTQLGEVGIEKNDTVFLGYVGELREQLSNDKTFESISIKETTFYTLYRFRIAETGAIVSLLGVRYCFWGSIAEVLAFSICHFGVREIIYGAKLGTLTKPTDIYTRPFCPSEFVVLDYNKVKYRVGAIENSLLQKFPGLRTGLHASVPTVLEEDYEQRDALSALKVATIDNEISKIARAISLYNSLHGSGTQFSAVHFATDYIRKPIERLKRTKHDLSKDKLPKSRKAKRQILKLILTEVILPHLKAIR